MKEFSTLATYTKIFRKAYLLAGLLLLLCIPGILFAQTDSTKIEAKSEIEEPSLIAPSVDFISVQKSDKTIDLKAGLKAKIKGTFTQLPLLKITFRLLTDTEQQPLGFVITDQQGKAVLNVKVDSLKTDKEGKLHFKAMFAGNKSMDPADEEVTIKRARIEIVPQKEDSLLTVKIKLIDEGTGAEVPVPEIAVGIFVKRLFSTLKVAEGTTDSTGQASVEIPNNLPGDTKGNITLLAKVDENELYGNIEATVIQPWGTIVSDKLNELPRALWSPHPPLWMLITFAILMTVVWGHYLVIIIQLFRLRKEEPHTPIPVTKS